MSEKIAVLGAGGTGHAIAADLTLAGFEICLYEEPGVSDSLQEVVKRGGIEITGAVNQGFARISRTTTDIKEALEGAEIVLVAVLALRHERVAELCAPHVKDGQVIVIGPGNAGSIIFNSIFKGKGVKGDVSIAELAGNYYPCRLIGPAKVVVALPRGVKRIAAFPARDTGKVIGKLDRLKGIYDFTAATNVLETTLSAPNIVNHLAGSLLNTGAIEKSGGEYYLYRQGLTPSILRCIDAVAAERKALFDALGYSISPDTMLEKVMRSDEFPELDIFRGLIGPTSMQHRYIEEDATVGQALMVSLGEMINVPTPLTRALLMLASTINQMDYLAVGRTVEKLGLSGMSVGQLNRFLAEG